jgi:Domain of unknown function (DUF4198)
MRATVLWTLAAMGSAWAHDLYLMPEHFHVANGETVGVAVHDGDAFPDSEVSAALERLRDASLRGALGAADVRNLHVDGKRVIGTVAVPGEGDLLLTVRTIPNFIALEADQFTAYLKEEGLTQVIEARARSGDAAKAGRERYSKFAKAILLAGAPDEQYGHAVGFAIEIIPEKNPYQLKAGDALPVQVLFRGAAAADLQVEAAWAGGGVSKVQVIGRTDAQGRITVPLAAAGKWRLHSLKMERCTDASTADWESYWASLTFEIR